jgi:hypothetical protein
MMLSAGVGVAPKTLDEDRLQLLAVTTNCKLPAAPAGAPAASAAA